MKTLDRFLLHEMRKTFVRCEVGFCIDDVQPYNKALASVRMRCYDLMEWLEREGIRAELYKPFKKYKVVFFIKTRSDKALRIAGKLRKSDTVLIMDPYCEFIDDEGMKDNWERKNVLKLIGYMDIINVCSLVQRDKFAKYHRHVNFIGDNVHESFFAVKKDYFIKSKPTLIYCGYHKKARDILCIKEIILTLQETMGCELILLTDKDPDIQEIPYHFVKYDQTRIAEQLIMGDIMIAPRPMEGIERLSHSNTKIAYPMAVGLPVAASPVPSYLDSPAVICRSEEEWYRELTYLINDMSRRKEIGESGRQFIREHYSLEHLGKIYKNMILQSLKG